MNIVVAVILIVMAFATQFGIDAEVAVTGLSDELLLLRLSDPDVTAVLVSIGTILLAVPAYQLARARDPRMGWGVAVFATGLVTYQMYFVGTIAPMLYMLTFPRVGHYVIAVVPPMTIALGAALFISGAVRSQRAGNN